MKRSHLLLIALLALVVGGLWWVGATEGTTGQEQQPDGPVQPPAVADPQGFGPGPTSARGDLRQGHGQSHGLEADAAQAAVPPSAFELPGEAVLACRVTQGGQAVPGADVLGDGRLLGQTDGQGRLDLAIGELWAGGERAWLILRAQRGELSAVQRVEPRAQSVELQLAPAAAPRLSGQVVEASGGAPVSGIEVWADGVHTLTGADGRFDLPLAHEHGPRFELRSAGITLAEHPLLTGRELRLVVPARGACTVSLAPAHPASSTFSLEVHGWRGSSLALLTRREWKAGEPPIHLGALPLGLASYLFVASGPGHGPVVSHQTAGLPPTLLLSLPAEPPLRLFVPAGAGRQLVARALVRLSDGASVEEQVALDSAGRGQLYTLGPAQEIRLELWAEVGPSRAKLPLACASVRPDASGEFVLSELALGDLSVHLPAPPAGPFALLGNHWPTQGAARPCPYGDSLGARRGWHMVLPGPGPHLLPLPLGRFSLVLVDLGSDARSTHDLAVDGAQTLHLPAPIPPHWVEFTLLRNGQPLCGRSFQWLGAPAGWESVSGVTDSTGGSRVPLEPGATGRLMVAGDEGLAAASVHELGALAGRQLIDVPPPATLRLASGHPWTVSARPLWTSASFFRGSAGLPLAGLLQARLPAPSDALLLSPGTWDVELSGPGGTHTLKLSLYPGETREWAPGR